MHEPSPYRDADGNPIDVLTWIGLYDDLTNRILADDTVETPDGTLTVRTVWSGVHEPAIDVHVFGTGISAEPGPWTEVAQYDTNSDALAGHQRVLDALRGAPTDAAPAADDRLAYSANARRILAVIDELANGAERTRPLR